MKKLSILIVLILSFFIFLTESKAAGVADTSNVCSYTDYKSLLDCNPDKKTCIQEFVTGGCNGVCPFENLSSQECLSCLSSSCGIVNGNNESIAESNSGNLNDEVVQSVIDAITSITRGSTTDTSTNQNEESLCNSSAGENCKYCSASEHGTCVRNCINNEYVAGGKCYYDCYYEGQGYYLDSKSCNECLNKVCDRELREGDRLLEPGQKEDAGDWDFCDKHGVLKSMQIINKSLFVAKIIIPLLLIVFGSIELAKAVVFSDDNTIKNCVNSLIKKMIIALIVFFVPTIVKSVFGLIDDYTSLRDNGCYVCLFGENRCDDLVANSNDD